MTTAELAIKFDELKRVVSDFILTQKPINERVLFIDEKIRGNGHDGYDVALVKIDGRITVLEKNDGRRQKLVDALTGGLALTLVLEILRLIFSA